MIKNDILDRKDIQHLVNSFYEKVKDDILIGPLFTDVAQTNWAVHLPKMYDFWEVIVFGRGSFKGNPMMVHKQLHNKIKLKQAHFDRWLSLFYTTVDELFEGENAQNIKYSASNIAQSLFFKITHF